MPFAGAFSRALREYLIEVTISESFMSSSRNFFSLNGTMELQRLASMCSTCQLLKCQHGQLLREADYSRERLLSTPDCLPRWVVGSSATENAAPVGPRPEELNDLHSCDRPTALRRDVLQD